MNFSNQGSSAYLRITRSSIVLFCNLIMLGCVSYTLSPDSPWQEVAFDINGTFLISMNLPRAQTDQVHGKPTFFAAETGKSERLFTAMYDPGVGKTKDLLLTTIWATVHSMEDSARTNGKIAFDEINSKFFAKDQIRARDYAYLGSEKIDETEWYLVNLKTQSKGVAYSSEIFPGYILIVGVRVFGNDKKVSELREYRIETLEEIVRSIRIQKH